MAANKKNKSIDFLDLWEDKRFLGAEFLTWLWLSSEVSPEFKLPGDSGSVAVTFESSLKLEIGQGASKRSVSCQTPAESDSGHEWAEALTAITRFKKVVGAKIKLQTEKIEWLLTLPADTLAPRQIKISDSSASKEKDDEPLAQVGQFLDRVALILELNSILEQLLGIFLNIRLTSAWEDEELPRLRGWVRRWIQESGGPGEE